MVECQKPKAETNLVAHLGSRFVFHDITETEIYVSLGQSNNASPYPAMILGWAQTAFRASVLGSKASRHCTAISRLYERDD